MLGATVPAQARPDAYPTRRGASAVMLRPLRRWSSVAGDRAAATRPRPASRGRAGPAAAAISDRPWCRGRALPARRCRRCYAGGAGQDVGASGSQRSGEKRGPAWCRSRSSSSASGRPKAISAIRLRISRGVRGARSASSGLICTRTTSRGTGLDERHQRWIGAEPAVPVRRAIDLHRVVQLRQAGRGEDHVDVQFGVAEDPGAAGRDIGRGDEQAGRFSRAQAREVDQPLEHRTQWVHPQRVELVGRQELGGEVRGQLAQTAGAQRSDLGQSADFSPQLVERLRAAGATAAQPSRREHDRVQRAPEAPLMPSIRRSASSRRTSTPRVKALWAPPPEGRD